MRFVVLRVSIAQFCSVFGVVGGECDHWSDRRESDES